MMMVMNRKMSDDEEDDDELDGCNRIINETSKRVIGQPVVLFNTT